MQWKNKGFECLHLKNNLEQILSKTSVIYLYGAGQKGELWSYILTNIFKTTLKIKFIDNNKKIIGNKINGVEIVSYDSIIDFNDSIIVVSVGGSNKEEISEQLIENGLSKNVDYFDDEDFWKMISSYMLYKDAFFIEKYVQISLVEKCTLKCKLCAHSCPYIRRNNKQELSYEEAKKSIDFYFKFVDYVVRLDILGGEPLLCSYLDDLIKYIGDNYRERIKEISITTNGTILPDKVFLELCKKYDISIWLSDYSESFPKISQRVECFKSIIKDSGVSIKSIYGNGEKWVDLGLRELNLNEDYAINIFEKCKSECREIRLNRFYYCIIARCASEFLYNDEGELDYLDLSTLEGESGKKIMYEFSNGFNDIGYLEMCKHCRGLCASEKYLVRPGEQLV